MKLISQRRIIANPALHGPAPRLPAGVRVKVRAPLPLGDWVERWAKPIARLIDGVSARLGRPTKLAGCSRCSRRRRLFNDLVPDVASWRVWRRALRRVFGRALSRLLGHL